MYRTKAGVRSISPRKNVSENHELASALTAGWVSGVPFDEPFWGVIYAVGIIMRLETVKPGSIKSCVRFGLRAWPISVRRNKRDTSVVCNWTLETALRSDSFQRARKHAEDERDLFQVATPRIYMSR